MKKIKLYDVRILNGLMKYICYDYDKYIPKHEKIRKINGIYFYDSFINDNKLFDCIGLHYNKTILTNYRIINGVYYKYDCGYYSTYYYNKEENIFHIYTNHIPNSYIDLVFVPSKYLSKNVYEKNGIKETDFLIFLSSIIKYNPKVLINGGVLSENIINYILKTNKKLEFASFLYDENIFDYDEIVRNSNIKIEYISDQYEIEKMVYDKIKELYDDEPEKTFTKIYNFNSDIDFIKKYSVHRNIVKSNYNHDYSVLQNVKLLGNMYLLYYDKKNNIIKYDIRKIDKELLSDDDLFKIISETSQFKQNADQSLNKTLIYTLSDGITLYDILNETDIDILLKKFKCDDMIINDIILKIFFIIYLIDSTSVNIEVTEDKKIKLKIHEFSFVLNDELSDKTIKLYNNHLLNLIKFRVIKNNIIFAYDNRWTPLTNSKYTTNKVIKIPGNVLPLRKIKSIIYNDKLDKYFCNLTNYKNIPFDEVINKVLKYYRKHITENI